MEILLEKISPDRLEVVLQYLLQLDRLFGSQIPIMFQQTPAGILEYLLIAILEQSPGFFRSDLVDRLVELLDDVEAIQYVQGILCLLSDHLQVRFPHVAADELQEVRAFLAQHTKELQ